MASRLPFILDVDTGIDDAAALALAIASSEIELLAVTTVAGNVDITQTTDNTQRVLSWLGAGDIPVHRGASRPLTKPHHDAAHIHGSNGLGGASFPESNAPIGRDRGPAAIIRLAMANPGEITLVCVGPLTNLAIALNVEPSLVNLLKRVVIMGGSFFNPGNSTPFAEFNIYVDPEAAEQVFSSNFSDMTLVGLDASHQTALTRDEWESAGRVESASATLLNRVYTHSFTTRGKSDCYLHDPLALAIAIDPTLGGVVTGHAGVVLDSERRGQTTLSTGSGATKVVESVDVDRFKALFNLRLGV